VVLTIPKHRPGQLSPGLDFPQENGETNARRLRGNSAKSLLPFKWKPHFLFFQSYSHPQYNQILEVFIAAPQRFHGLGWWAGIVGSWRSLLHGGVAGSRRSRELRPGRCGLGRGIAWGPWVLMHMARARMRWCRPEGRLWSLTFLWNHHSTDKMACLRSPHRCRHRLNIASVDVYL